MDFNSDKPIYLQISDDICEKILSGQYEQGSRILSVREYGAEIGVNPNTVARSYEKLTDAGIIFIKRGIGYFVSGDAKNLVQRIQKKEFLEKDAPAFLKKMKLLGITLDEIKEII